MFFALVGLLAYVVLVAAFAIPATLMAGNDEPVDEAAAARIEQYADEHDRFVRLQVELGVAQCEADAEAAEAGALVLELEDALDDTSPLGIDTSLLKFDEKTPLLTAIETASEQLAALDVPQEQRSLVSTMNDQMMACNEQDVEVERVPPSDPPTEQELTDLQSRITGIESELEEVAPIGVALDDVVAIIEPLGPALVAAAETRTSAEYYQGFLANGSAETLESFVEASGELDEIVQEYSNEASPALTLQLFVAVVDLAEWSNQVVAEHNQGPVLNPPTTNPPPTNPPSPPPSEESDPEPPSEEPEEPVEPEESEFPTP